MDIVKLNFDKEHFEYFVAEEKIEKKEPMYVFEYFLAAVNAYIDPYNEGLIDSINPSIGTHELDFDFIEGKCIIQETFLFSIKDENKQEIYNKNVIFEQKELTEAIHFFDSTSQEASNEEISLSKDDNNIYIVSNQKSYVLRYQCRTSVAKYHYLTDEDAEDFDSHDCQNDKLQKVKAS